MNTPPDNWDDSFNTWVKMNRYNLERVFVSLRRECTQVEEVDKMFQVRFTIEDVAKWLSDKRYFAHPEDS